jgi:hypothetical protein
MISAASSLEGRSSGGIKARANNLPLHVLKRRQTQRRHTLAMQAQSYGPGAAALLDWSAFSPGMQVTILAGDAGTGRYPGYQFGARRRCALLSQRARAQPHRQRVIN